MKIPFEVTSYEIEIGTTNPDFCPVAIAINKNYPGRHASVKENNTVMVVGPEDNRVFVNSPYIKQWVSAFDAYKTRASYDPYDPESQPIQLYPPPCFKGFVDLETGEIENEEAPAIE